MKNLRVEYDKFEPFEFNFDSLIQIAGCNSILKKQLYFVMKEYFSSRKLVNSDNCKITLEGEVLSEGHFEFIGIFDESDLNKQIGMGKDSIFLNILKSVENSVEFNELLVGLNDKLLWIDSFVESNLSNNLGFEIKLESKEFGLSDYLKNLGDVEIGDLSVQFLSNYEKLEIFLRLLRGFVQYHSGSFMVALWDVNNLFSNSDFSRLGRLIIDLIHDFGVRFLVFSSIGGYIVDDVNFFEGISVFNDIVFSFCDLSLFKGSIVRNYPSLVDFSEAFIFDFIKVCGCNLFLSDYRYGYSRFDVIIKVLNSFYGVECALGGDSLVDSLELAFLRS